MGQQTYENINPYTDDTMKALTDMMDPNGQWATMAAKDTGAASFENFQQMAPYLQNLVMGPQSTFRQGQMDLAANTSRTAQDAALQGFSGMGGMYSGAAQKAASTAAINPYMQAANNVNQMGAQMTGQLWNTGLGLSGQTAMADANRGASLYGTGMGAMASMGDPVMAYQPSPLDRLLQFGQLGAATLPLIL